jgi:hypothetical protein
MNRSLRELLGFLDGIVDGEQQRKIRERYRASLSWEDVDRPPLVLTYPLPLGDRFQPFPHREVFDDMEKMLHNELIRGFEMSHTCQPRVGDDLPITVRANYGIGIIPSLFGARVEQHLDDPPWVLGYEDEKAFLSVMDRDPFDFSQGLAPKVLQTLEFFGAALSDYANLRAAVALVLPDLQGPIDNAELLRGSDLFLDLIEEEERTDRLLSLMAKAQVGFARKLKPFITEPVAGFCHQHGVMLGGNILIRDDTAVMVSKEMYERAVAPHDEWVLKAMGGGGIHSCGNVNHLASAYLDLEHNRSLDLGQPLMNDLGRLYAEAKARRIALIRIDVDEDDLRSGVARDRFSTGVVFKHDAKSLDHAREIYGSYSGT